MQPDGGSRGNANGNGSYRELAALPANGASHPGPRAGGSGELLRRHADDQLVLDFVAGLESLWNALQARRTPDLLPVDAIEVLVEEVERRFPVALTAVYRVEPRTLAFELERTIPAGLDEDLAAEVDGLIEGGGFAVALRRGRATVFSPGVMRRYHPRVRAVVLAPLIGPSRAHGMIVLGVERSEPDLEPNAMRLLSLLASQTAAWLEGADREAELRNQARELECSFRVRLDAAEDRERQLAERVRLLEARLVESEARVERFAHETGVRERLLATVSHELRTPLGAIIGSIGILQEEWGERLPRDLQHLVEMCRRNGEMLLTLVCDLLDAAALKNGRVSLQRRSVRLPAVVDLSFDVLEPAARASGVRLVNAVDPGLEAHADPVRLQQILINLVSNGIKYGGPTDPFVRVSAEKTAEGVVVTVADNGLGIAPEKLERVFEPFERGDGRFVSAQRGTGLGLAICRGLVESHGGRIWVEAGPGPGTRFHFLLPAGDAPRADARQRD